MPLCKFLTATSHSGPRVPAGTRPSLRPLSFEGKGDEAKLGRNAPREGEGVSANEMRIKRATLSPILRHCERSEAIQSLSAEGFRIASLRS
jgi:hypothetical protein